VQQNAVPQKYHQRSDPPNGLDIGDNLAAR